MRFSDAHLMEPADTINWPFQGNSPYVSAAASPPILLLPALPMTPFAYHAVQKIVHAVVPAMRHAANRTAIWVTQLSWKNFLLFALLLAIAGSLVQQTLFSTSDRDVIMMRKKNAGARTKRVQSERSQRITSADGTTVMIDETGLHITRKPLPVSTHTGSAPPTLGTDPGSAATTAPSPPALPADSVASDLHIMLPPGVAKEIQAALKNAVAQAAEQEVSVAQKKSSEWFMNFILLLIVGLFGTKALMGGKKRAEGQAEAAHIVAERATLQRQISEAKMQVMQAQVEPHFLFNTLASVEYLIETDPPRASAMQRRLIQYLRAVLPQMRDNTVATTLGREADMVRAYLDLLKMRMEERLQIDFSIPTGLRSAAFPPMMLQSLVENAIKHGLERMAEGGTLTVFGEIIDNRLRVTVSDTGLGFGVTPSDGTGLGLQSIRQRLLLLYQGQAALEIAPNQPCGVRASIEVPYQLAGAASPAANSPLHATTT